ncbi:MAG: SIS domain-containing protein, partial [Actinobacteria bacterium]|nr:SIS domain-containing protein [Actinomycetota bacterium]
MIKKVLGAIELHKKLIDDFEKKDIDKIIRIAEIIANSFKNGHQVYICGNGGSAADSQHLAGELIGRFHKKRKALPAVALTVDTSVITCIANDFSYDEIFKRQLEALLCPGDILLLFSTSGKSKKHYR